MDITHPLQKRPLSLSKLLSGLKMGLTPERDNKTSQRRRFFGAKTSMATATFPIPATRQVSIKAVVGLWQPMGKKIFVIVLFFLLITTARCRRGRTRAKTKSKIINGLPITGKFRDPESDQYYNNNNGAKIILSSHFDYEYVLGHKIAFLCVARGNPRPRITWFKDGIELYAHYLSHVHEWKLGPDKVKSKLEIDPATQMDAGIYECSANNMYSIDSRSFKTDFSIAFD